jgi:hypothetical protein
MSMANMNKIKFYFMGKVEGKILLFKVYGILGARRKRQKKIRARTIVFPLCLSMRKSQKRRQKNQSNNHSFSALLKRAEKPPPKKKKKKKKKRTKTTAVR